ncbi:hypothetical protein [Hydrogenophaga sp.]|nr:hypothetical protein [Hydrogenophaga sp.]
MNELTFQVHQCMKRVDWLATSWLRSAANFPLLFGQAGLLHSLWSALLQ